MQPIVRVCAAVGIADGTATRAPRDVLHVVLVTHTHTRYLHGVVKSAEWLALVR